MSSLPNILSMSRFFLAFLLFSQSTAVRLLAIFLAAATDFLDGYLARRFLWKSKIGTTIDPLSDQFFVLMGLSIFLQEGTLTLKQALLMLSRDAAVILFGMLLLMLGKLKHYSIHAIVFGKVTTVIQLIVFIFLTLGLSIPSAVFILFGFLGFLSLFELIFDDLLAKRDHARVDTFEEE